MSAERGISLSLAPGRLSLNHTFLIVAFAIAVFLPGLLAGGDLLSHHEVLAAQPAKEMLAGGDWLVQTYVGVPRYEKPPATSWLIAASMAIFHTEAAWAVRLPSILSAIFCSVVIGHLAAKWLGATAGLVAAAIQLTTVWMQTQANLAEADIHVVCAVTVAFCLFALGNVEHPRGTVDTRPVRIGFMAAAAISFLFKGPAPLLFISSGSLAYMAMRRDWKRFRFFLDPWALALFAPLVIAWPAAAYVHDPNIWDAWMRELTGRGHSDSPARKDVLLYVCNVPLSLLPWTLLLVPTAVRAWQRKTSLAPLEVLLLAWFVPGMLMLQIASYKSTHYAYPMLPPLSIAMAAGFVLWLRWQNTFDRPLFPRAWLAGFILIAGVAGVAATLLLRPRLPLAASMIAVVVTFGLLLTLRLESRSKLALSVVCLFVTVATAIALANALLIPTIRSSSSRKEFADRVNHAVQAGQPLYLVNFAGDEIVWHLRVPMKRIDELAEFESQPLPANGATVLTRLRALPSLQQKYVIEELDRVSKPTRADISGPESLLPVLVHLWPERAGNAGPWGRPATQAATAPATAPAGRPGPSE